VSKECVIFREVFSDAGAMASASKGRRERKYVEMDERDDAARPQGAETNWFKVLTFGYAPRPNPRPGGRRFGMPACPARTPVVARDSRARTLAQTPEPAAGDGFLASDFV